MLRRGIYRFVYESLARLFFIFYFRENYKLIIMEKLIVFLWRSCAPLVGVAVFLLLTAFECSTETGNADTRPTFLSTYTEAQDISIGTVQLGYDLSSFVRFCMDQYKRIPEATISQLSSSHNIDPWAPGSLTLSNLLVGPYFSDTPPEVRFVFSDPYCQGELPYIYNTDDGYLCFQNKIRNAPKLRATTMVDFFAHTIKTVDEVSIKWRANLYPILSSGTASMDISVYGNVDFPSFGFLASSTKSENNEVAVRVYGKFAEVVENTFNPNRFQKKNSYSMRPVARQIVFSDVLGQDVCAGGRAKTNYKWMQPEIVELINK